MQDDEIISGLKKRDDNCFIEVVNMYKKKIISLCYTYTKDYQEAEDLSQETFITLYNSIYNFRGDCSLSTYIYRIAVSRCLDYKRKRSIKGFLNGLITIYGGQDEDIDEKNYVRSCIKSLNEELKLPVVLYYYIGLSQKEIADILKVSPKTVEGRIYRAKQKLKLEFEKGGLAECRE